MRLLNLQNKTARARRAFTLVEALITSATLVIVLGSVVMCNLYGLSMAVRQQIWLGASDDAAGAIGTLMEDIRSATSLEVGSYSNSVFTQTASTGQQSGNALMIFTNSSTLPWTLYYYDSTSNNLVRSNYYGPSVNGDSKLVSANPITNDVTHPIFTEVDYTGTALSNATPLTAVTIYLSFTKLQDPDIVIESGSSVDLYQIITTVSPRLRL